MYIECWYIYIYIYIYNIGISKHEKHDFLVQVRNFLLLLSLKVLRHKKRDTHSFYSGFFICPHPISLRHLPKDSMSKRKSTVSFGVQFSTQLTDFFKIPKSSACFRCVTSFTLASPVSHLGCCDLSAWHVRSMRARTLVLMLHLSNPCTEPTGSQPN